MSLKKVFIATGIAFAAAAAQSADVSIYGIVDMGLLIRNTASIEGAAGTLAESKTSVGVESGQYYPNTFGLKGEEDLGNGLKAGFMLENTFNSDTGAMFEEGSFFNNQSVLYLEKSGYMLAMGRMKALTSTMGYFDYGAFMEPFEGSWRNAGSSVLAMIGQDVRNAVALDMHPSDSIRITGMYSLAQGETEETTYSSNRHYMGLAASYSQGGLWAAVSYEHITQGHEGAEYYDGNEAHVAKFAVNYDFGPVRPFFVYSFANGYDWGWEGPAVKTHSFVLGATSPVAGGTARFSVQYLKGSSEKADDGKDFEPEVVSAAIGYTYPLSKRTTFYSVASYAFGSKSLDKDWDSDYSMAGLDGRQNANAAMVSLGLMHTF